MPNERLFTVFSKWKSLGRSQTELARLASIHPSSLSRAFAGEIRPDLETFGKILSAAAPVEPDWARELLEAYLFDAVPPGNAPDDTAWIDHVRIVVEAFAAPRLRDPGPADELDLALDYLIRQARTTKHGRQLVLAFYHMRHPGSYQRQSQG